MKRKEGSRELQHALLLGTYDRNTFQRISDDFRCIVQAMQGVASSNLVARTNTNERAETTLTMNTRVE